MLFNIVNVDNRDRYSVNGRVIVFTDSLRVEYLENNLRHSFPLYSNLDGYPIGHGLAFVVEMQGYLTFDKESQVHIVEVGSFTGFYYQPTNFSIVAPADTPVYRINDFEVWGTDGHGKINEVHIMHEGPAGDTDSWFIPINTLPESETLDALARNFILGSVWKGPKGYPDYTISTKRY